MRALYSILLLSVSNVFMTFAWYGHLRFGSMKWSNSLGLFSIILLSWGIAFFEYCFQVPANRLGSSELGGPFSLVQLKVIQEAITLVTFVLFVSVYFKNETLHWNHYVGFGLLILAVYFIFRK